jgi:2-polyprenyl-3-methyl-5-hydroxy-6-metoxy-1,4-benzoquinol methylase
MLQKRMDLKRSNEEEKKVRHKSIKENTEIDYSEHFNVLNPGGTNESTYLACRYYYEAEVKALLPEDKSAKIVDIGSGYGHLLRYLKELGYLHIGAVDSSEKLIQEVKSYLGSGLDFACRADAIQFLCQLPTRFDFITLFDVLEHFTLEDAKKLARAVRESLKDGGRVVIRTPNMANILGMYSRYMDLTHYHGYTELSLRQLLREAGFSTIELHFPDWSSYPERVKNQQENIEIHKKLFRLHDRVEPKCFDKNIIMWARK